MTNLAKEVDNEYQGLSLLLAIVSDQKFVEYNVRLMLWAGARSPTA